MELFASSDATISIHSLRMEGDETTFLKIAGFEIFQSTPSAWRETRSITFPHCKNFPFQSTPSAWRETFKPFALKTIL